MPKIKTHKGTTKRVKLSKNGKNSKKLMFEKASGSHFMLKKSPGRKRKIGKNFSIGSTHAKAIKSLLGV